MFNKEMLEFIWENCVEDYIIPSDKGFHTGFKCLFCNSHLDSKYSIHHKMGCTVAGIMRIIVDSVTPEQFSKWTDKYNKRKGNEL